jgi:uncharacterized protein (DUF362 family)/Pyruvate/2-oxoacid:ferredoxin oxidoreductase delta subunit
MSPRLSQVSLSRCRDYQQAHIDRAVNEVLSSLPALPLKKGDRVLLKPNCLSSHHGPEKPVNTRPEVVEGVGRYLKDAYGVELLIADSGGMGSYGRTRRTYALLGLEALAGRLEARLVNLEEQGFISIKSPGGKIVPVFKATSLLNEIEAIVNLPKLKTHLLTGITGAVKNSLGLLPGSLKRDVHRRALTGSAMAQALVDIYRGLNSRVPFVLQVMDGIMAMEGAGPVQGPSRSVGWILASTDPVAMDCASAAIMGFRPGRIATITLAAAAGLGEADPAAIKLQGAAWEELPVPGFKRPFSQVREWLGRMLPPKLTGRALDWLTEARPRLNPGGCRLCGLCVQACPAEALHLEGENIVLTKSQCIECYCCLEHCPGEGLWIPRGLKEKVMGRKH